MSIVIVETATQTEIARACKAMDREFMRVVAVVKSPRQPFDIVTCKIVEIYLVIGQGDASQSRIIERIEQMIKDDE